MTEKKQIYHCEKCGNVAESLWTGPASMQCCGDEMVKLIPNTTDAVQEKHVPVIERNGTKVTVKVGGVEHPMTPDHYILFIEVLAGDKVFRHDFREGDTHPVAEFRIEEQDLVARAFCNLHGFWSSK